MEEMFTIKAGKAEKLREQEVKSKYFILSLQSQNEMGTTLACIFTNRENNIGRPTGLGIGPTGCI